MLSSTQATGAFEPVTLAGRTLRIRQLKLREWAELQAWLKNVCPSPVAVALCELAKLHSENVVVPQTIQDGLFRQAQEETRRWPPRVGTVAWLKALEDQEGGRARFLLAAIKPSGEKLTEEEASDLMEQATDSEISELIRVSLWGDHEVPKVQTPSEMTQMKILTRVTNGEPSSSVSANSGQLGPMETLGN